MKTTFLYNIGKFVPDYTASYTRAQYSSPKMLRFTTQITFKSILTHLKHHIPDRTGTHVVTGLDQLV